MKKKQYILNEPIDIDFKIIGLVTDLDHVECCYVVNKCLGSTFGRALQDVELLHKKDWLFFPTYTYKDRLKNINWVLLKNGSAPDEKYKSLFTDVERIKSDLLYLISDRKDVDYFLIFHPPYYPQELNEMKENLRQMDQFGAVFQIDVNGLEHPDYLLT